MSKQHTIKKLIDVILAFLYIALLGYLITGGLFHEIAGIIFVILVVIHNIVNIRWYKSLSKGTYTTKRKLTIIINLALIIDITVILLTGIINSRYLFNTGLHMASTTQIHTIGALIGFVLIVSHIVMHAFSHTKKQHKKLPIILVVFSVIIAIALYLWGFPYLERHFKTVEMDLQTTISGEQVNFDGKKIAIVYFTRVGNSNFEEDIDAVSGASLLLDENGELMGNSQVIAQMIQNAAGGDILSINTEKRYPSSYGDTISVASDELRDLELPTLINMPDNLDDYDTIFLVYPLWWYKIPKAVESFLVQYDFSEKTIIPVVTHGGSGAGKSLADIKTACGGTVIENPLEVYCGDIPTCRDDVTEWLKEIAATLQ